MFNTIEFITKRRLLWINIECLILHKIYKTAQFLITCKFLRKKICVNTPLIFGEGVDPSRCERNTE